MAENKIDDLATSEVVLEAHHASMLKSEEGVDRTFRTVLIEPLCRAVSVSIASFVEVR